MPGSIRSAQAPSTRPSRRRQNGQILVIFAGALIALIGIVAIVVDVSWYWANTLRVQRAADAAALAGAVWLPGQPSTGFTTADAEATKNGYTTGGATVVTPTQDSVDPRQLDITISAPVGTFFMRVFGINTITATRTAKAVYVQAVPMGSPQAYYGVGCFVLQNPATPACTIPNPPSGSVTSQGGWGAIITKGGNEQNGDAYAPANDGGGGGFGGGGNALYDSDGYYYLAVVPQAGGSIYVFDPGFCAMGANGSAGDYGAGDHWIAGNTNPVSTYYTLFNTNGVPGIQASWTQKYASGNLFENQTASDTANGGPASSNGTDPTMHACDANHNKWWLMRSGLAAGTYAIEVQTTNPGNAAINQNTNAENMFSLLVSGGGSPQVYGSGKMATYNNLTGGLQKFYLAQIDQKTGAGKTAEIDLFDPGDVGGNAFLKILSPDGGSQSYATFNYTTDANCGVTATANGKPQSDLCQNNNVTQIQTANAGSSSFNNTWIRITIPLKATYGSSSLWQGGWWQIEYNVSNGNDTTTWQVSVNGNPVHLVVP